MFILCVRVRVRSIARSIYRFPLYRIIGGCFFTCRKRGNKKTLKKFKEEYDVRKIFVRDDSMSKLFDLWASCRRRRRRRHSSSSSFFHFSSPPLRKKNKNSKTTFFFLALTFLNSKICRQPCFF